jgi:hypothetical protein
MQLLQQSHHDCVPLPAAVGTLCSKRSRDRSRATHSRCRWSQSACRTHPRIPCPGAANEKPAGQKEQTAVHQAGSSAGLERPRARHGAAGRGRCCPDVRPVQRRQNCWQKGQGMHGRRCVGSGASRRCMWLHRRHAGPEPCSCRSRLSATCKLPCMHHELPSCRQPTPRVWAPCMTTLPFACCPGQRVQLPEGQPVLARRGRVVGSHRHQVQPRQRSVRVGCPS